MKTPLDKDTQELYVKALRRAYDILWTVYQFPEEDEEGFHRHSVYESKDHTNLTLLRAVFVRDCSFGSLLANDLLSEVIKQSNVTADEFNRLSLVELRFIVLNTLHLKN